jgi:uncharacterized protein YqeY
MSLRDRLAQDLKDAMRARDDTRKATIRLLRSAINAAEIEKRATFIESQQARNVDIESLELTDEQFALTDEEVLDVLQKQAKQRRDSIAEFEKAGRDDLVEGEQAELSIIESYLPRQMTRDEVEAATRHAAAELGVSDMSGMGPLMRHLMAELKGRADGRMVNQVVREVLSGGQR